MAEPIKGAKLQITRIIVIEGDAKWALDTLSRSLLPDSGKEYQAAFGKISCTLCEHVDVK